MSSEIFAANARRAEAETPEGNGTQVLGQMVQYRPGARSLREAGGAYSITGFLPENDGQPAYRIRHFGEEHERVAQESELSAN
jgi:hypothetical protein